MSDWRDVGMGVATPNVSLASSAVELLTLSFWHKCYYSRGHGYLRLIRDQCTTWKEYCLSSSCFRVF